MLLLVGFESRLDFGHVCSLLRHLKLHLPQLLFLVFEHGLFEYQLLGLYHEVALGLYFLHLLTNAIEAKVQLELVFALPPSQHLRDTPLDFGALRDVCL